MDTNQPLSMTELLRNVTRAPHALCVCGKPRFQHRISIGPGEKAFYGENEVDKDGQEVRDTDGKLVFHVLCEDFTPVTGETDPAVGNP